MGATRAQPQRAPYPCSPTFKPPGGWAEGPSGRKEVADPAPRPAVRSRELWRWDPTSGPVSLSAPQREPPPAATRAGRQAGRLPGLPHRPQQPKPRSAGSRSQETPTVLAQAEVAPVLPEPQAGECSPAAFGKGTCQNTVSGSYGRARFEAANFSLTTLQAPVFSSSFPATAAGLFP